MATPDGGALLDPAWVERVVHGLAGWPFGPLRVVDVTRIGVEHSLSGQVHRVAASTADRDRLTFIIKRDPDRVATRDGLVERARKVLHRSADASADQTVMRSWAAGYRSRSRSVSLVAAAQ